MINPVEAARCGAQCMDQKHDQWFQHADLDMPDGYFCSMPHDPERCTDPTWSVEFYSELIRKWGVIIHCLQWDPMIWTFGFYPRSEKSKIALAAAWRQEIISRREVVA